MSESQYLTAKQVYAQYAIPRSALRDLVDEGRVRCDELTIGEFTLKRYYREDVEKVKGGIVNG